MTSESSHFCHRILPVRRSKAASAWLAPAGRGLPPDTPAAGYEVNTTPSAMVGELVSGSPSQYDHRCSPVSASTANTVHDSVLNTQTPSAQTVDDGPSSSRLIAQAGLPLVASNAYISLERNPPET